MLYEFRWKDPNEMKKTYHKEPQRHYNDPTADQAIANVMRMQKKRKDKENE